MKEEEIQKAKNALKLRPDPNRVPGGSPNSTNSPKGSHVPRPGAKRHPLRAGISGGRKAVQHASQAGV
ncbi:hypothetical protein [Paenibacillus sp. UNC499MF]|uniref:hypothetical protein n=1 Tax=Paenibacillus sp. UNC499MF TaxID=1502751 RepID=UPI0015E1F390|nr:hypothetical protein [Paenibacillus sp. UNC499MF]